MDALTVFAIGVAPSFLAGAFLGAFLRPYIDRYIGQERTW